MRTSKLATHVALFTLYSFTMTPVILKAKANEKDDWIKTPLNYLATRTETHQSHEGEYKTNLIYTRESQLGKNWVYEADPIKLFALIDFFFELIDDEYCAFFFVIHPKYLPDSVNYQQLPSFLSQPFSHPHRQEVRQREDKDKKITTTHNFHENKRGHVPTALICKHKNLVHIQRLRRGQFRAVMSEKPSEEILHFDLFKNLIHNFEQFSENYTASRDYKRALYFHDIQDDYQE